MWLEFEPGAWCTAESKGRLCVRRVEDYHKIVGGDFYVHIPIDVFLVVTWGDRDTAPLSVCATPSEAQEALMIALKPA
jgi:hypothetical protein